MNPARKSLLKGSIKSAVGSATGMILSLNIVDPKDFSLASLGGLKHLGLVILVSVIVAEARFWKQWADSGDENGGTTNAPPKS